MNPSRILAPTSSVAVALAAMLVLASCDDAPSRRLWRASDHALPPEAANAPTSTRRLSPAEARAQAGTALFRMHCATCHGARGLGDGPSARGIAPPDLTTPEIQARLSDADIVRVIQEGRGAMPGFASTLDETGLLSLVGHVRALGARAAQPSTAPSPAAAP